MGRELGSTGSLPGPTKLSYCIKRMEPQHLGVGLASGKGPRYGYRDSNPLSPPLGVQKSLLFQAHRGASAIIPALADEKVSLCPQCREEGQGGLSDSEGWGKGTWNHFRRPLALRSPPSRLGLPSSVEDVVGSVWPHRAISACSATELATASSQPFISSWRKKQDKSNSYWEENLNHTALPSFTFLCYQYNGDSKDKRTVLRLL